MARAHQRHLKLWCARPVRNTPAGHQRKYELNQPKRPKRTWPVHCDMSAFGTKRTWAGAPQMSAFGGKADIPSALHMSAFDPKRTLLDSHAMASGYGSRQFAIARIDFSAAPLFPRLTNLCLEIPEAKYRGRR